MCVFINHFIKRFMLQYVLVYRSPSTPTNTDIIMADTSEVDGYVNQGELLSSFSCLHYINI